MRKTALTGLFVLAIFAAHSPSVGAQAPGLLQIDNKLAVTTAEPVMHLAVSDEQAEPEPQPKKEPEVKKHTVAEGDSLSTIAKHYDTSWKRLFDKNTSIEHPDVIHVSDELTIPAPDEKLKERPMPAAEPAPAEAPAKQRSATAASKPAATQYRGSSTGNTYTPGYCTWYVKNKRPSLPNGLGNADTWVSRARAMGMATGSAPRAGAVGQRGMHVVYVERVNGDGTVTISEMNHQGLYVITTRTLPASYFTYIY